MSNGLGPHDIIGPPEIIGTLVVLAFALMAMAWMAYETRWTHQR